MAKTLRAWSSHLESDLRGYNVSAFVLVLSLVGSNSSIAGSMYIRSRSFDEFSDRGEFNNKWVGLSQ